MRQHVAVSMIFPALIETVRIDERNSPVSPADDHMADGVKGMFHRDVVVGDAEQRIPRRILFRSGGGKNLRMVFP